MKPEDMAAAAHQQQNQNQMQINLNAILPKIDNEKCECGSELWQQFTVLKKISALISPTQKEELATLPVLACALCHASHPDNPIKFDNEKGKSALEL